MRIQKTTTKRLPARPIEKLAYSVKDAAEAVSLSATTITEAINAGDLPVFRPIRGGKTLNKKLIWRKDLEAWLNQGIRD